MDFTTEKIIVPLPLELASLHFLLSVSDDVHHDKAKTQAEVLEIIKSKKMVSLYITYCDEFKWPKDEALVTTMNASNAEELKKFDDAISDAEKNLGENEVREALLAKADFYCRIADKENALSAYRAAADKTVALGQRLDIVFSIIRIGLFWLDVDVVTRNLEKAKSLIEEGGDWERRNRLKVYEATWLLAVRDFKKAANLFLDSIATFTAYELFPYSTFVFYTVLTSIVSLDRVTLRSKVVEAPEVLSVIGDVPHLAQLLNSLYDCKYHAFFDALANIAVQIRADRYLSRHTRYFLREVRVVAYSQFLESYQSVTLQSMANAFGVSIAFLDGELSRFISAGRLAAKIDKVGGIVETSRPDSKNFQYQQMIRQGDLLLNRVQKLSRVISV
eukprot:CAMPEP_0184671304 /NCGR_PEP_ID=MMETSP0308-20130426/85415_1 /TAXON_ID=38269 /ORGANISM="Gloeochaete witrockiana, Strain SAG 46.84" /LENGTH=388 /DNA_ID=CAMNT_0027118395 /DNA_START=40 /DNA_END=1206 /DNA_ORIENTATION=+